MKKFTLLVVALGVVAACVQKSLVRTGHTPQVAESKLTLLHQSNRLGNLEPCGCQTNPYGGIDREANAIREIRRTEPNVLYVDAGNLLAPKKFKKLQDAKMRAKSIVKMLNEMGLEYFAPGARDYELGIDFLSELQNEAKFKFISTNVVRTGGAPAFSAFQLVEKGGVQYGLLSVSPSGIVKDPKFIVEDPTTALKKWIPIVAEHADVIILLSQFESKDHKALIEQFPDIRIVIGASDTFSAGSYWYPGGQQILADSENSGFGLGRLSINLKFPLKGFYSPTEVTMNQSLLKRFEADSKMEKHAKVYREARSIQPIEGGSIYDAELIKLDKERYGRSNTVTKILMGYREQVRRAALK